MSLKIKMTDIILTSNVEDVAFVGSNYMQVMIILSKKKTPKISQKIIFFGLGLPTLRVQDKHGK
jgi:hypothetical protein